jgi:hypothetical protein
VFEIMKKLDCAGFTKTTQVLHDMQDVLALGR